MFIFTKKSLLLFVLIFICSYWIYSQYYFNLVFGDEYDNLVNSWLLKAGFVPYRDYFLHHFPTLIFLGLPIEYIGHSLLLYRQYVFFVTFLFFTIFAFYFNSLLRITMLIFMLFSSFAISFYGGFQYAPGTFWAIFIMSAFFIVLKKQGDYFTRTESFYLGLLFILTMFSSPNHLPSFILIFLLHFYFQRQKYGKLSVKNNLINLKAFIFTTLASLWLFALYLTLTSAWGGFIYDTFTYNNQYFYSRLYTQRISPAFLDYYLNTIVNTVVYYRSLWAQYGSFLVDYLKAVKFAPISPLEYFLFISKYFYENFYNFDVIVSIFLAIGLISLFVSRKYAFLLFTVLFIFTLRIRDFERIHLAPYYLFSYWFISFTIVSLLGNLAERKHVFVSLVLLLVASTHVAFFIDKNMYDFRQTAYNRFPNDILKTTDYIKNNTNSADQLLVVSDNKSASYYYESERLPSGYFIHFFSWYWKSPELQQIWLKQLEQYEGKFMIVSLDPKSIYESESADSEWKKSTLETVKSLYTKKASIGNSSVYVKSDISF